jgi:hypothetical protein
VPLEVLRNAYFVVTLDDRSTSDQLVRVVRTSAGFSTIDALREQHLQLVARLDRLGRKGRCLLIDLRDAPGRRDPDFEAVMREVRPKLFAGWHRIGVLTSSALGLLQVRRHTREDGVPALSSTSEAEILEFLKAKDGD